MSACGDAQAGCPPPSNSCSPLTLSPTEGGLSSPPPCLSIGGLESPPSVIHNLPSSAKSAVTLAIQFAPVTAESLRASTQSRGRPGRALTNEDYPLRKGYGRDFPVGSSLVWRPSPCLELRRLCGVPAGTPQALRPQLPPLDIRRQNRDL